MLQPCHVIDNLGDWEFNPGMGRRWKNLTHYIIHASFSQERMTYILEEPKVLYQAKDGKKEKIFDALELASRPCTPMFWTRVSRWSVIMAIIVMSLEANEKCKPR